MYDVWIMYLIRLSFREKNFSKKNLHSLGCVKINSKIVFNSRPEATAQIVTSATKSIYLIVIGPENFAIF